MITLDIFTKIRKYFYKDMNLEQLYLKKQFNTNIIYKYKNKYKDKNKKTWNNADFILAYLYICVFTCRVLCKIMCINSIFD